MHRLWIQLKFRKKSKFISICFCLMCFYIISQYFKLNAEIGQLPLKQKSKNVNNGAKHSSLPPYFVGKFDPNLPDMRKRIVNVVNSESFSTPFINPEALYSVNLKNSLIPPPKRGFLNVYVWKDHCTQTIDMLKVKIGFPYNPSEKYITPSLELINQNKGFGQRVFGYIIPPISGEYSIEVTFSGIIEIWLSPNDQPPNAVKQQFTSPRSLFKKSGQVAYITVKLAADIKQYLEIMHVSSEECLLTVKWKSPDTTNYNQIQSNCYALYVNDIGPNIVSETYLNIFHFHEPIPDINQFFHTYDERNSIYSLPIVDIISIGSQENRLISLCDYYPFYVENRLIHEANDLQITTTNPDPKFFRRTSFFMLSNAIIPSEIRDRVLKIFMNNLNSLYQNVKLSRLINMERLEDPVSGDLYLLEVLVYVDRLSDKELLISEYIVLGHASFPQDVLCQPMAMKTHRNTFIHFLVTHRHFPHMLREFVQNMERIYVETGDENFGVIIVNYESPHINITTLLRQSKLRHWSIIEMNGSWEKTVAINLGIDSVRSPDDIIFTLDLSLHIPSHLPDTIRKHTFQGYAGFVPIIFYYFECIIPFDMKHRGFYSTTGFGLVGLFKSDWEKVGGMNTTKFKGNWGFEDNDLANRILENGYHLFRFTTRDFYHQPHDSVQLWGRKSALNVL